MQWTGRPVKRKEDPPLLLGRGRFVDDVKLPGLLYAKFIRSPYAHAKIKKIDYSSAVKKEGVPSCITGEELARITRPLSDAFISRPSRMRIPSFYPLAVGKTVYAGEPVACLVAKDAYTAADAADFIEVEYEPLDVVIDSTRALEPRASLLYEEWGDNVIFREVFEGGDKTVFEKADHVLKEEFIFDSSTGAPIETKGCVASYDAFSGMLTVWSSTQRPHTLRDVISLSLNHPESLTRVIGVDIGGAFGVKAGVSREDIVCSALSTRLGAPVKWIEDRSEHLTSAGSDRGQTHRIELAVNKDGIILGVRNSVTVDTGCGLSWPYFGVRPPVTGALSLPHPYRIQYYRLDLTCVVTNKSPVVAVRGFGRPPFRLAIERMLDIAGRRLGFDPLDMRLKNLVRANEVPYKTILGSSLDAGSFIDSMEMARREIDYDRIRKEQLDNRTTGRHTGIGIAVNVDLSSPASSMMSSLGPKMGGYDSVTIKVERDGSISVFLGSMPHGQGYKTTVSQVVADELGVPYDSIYVMYGDTLATPYSSGTYGDRGGGVTLSTCVLAARRLKGKILKVASDIAGMTTDQLKVENGQIISNNGKRLSVGELAEVSYLTPHLLPHGADPWLEVTTYHELPGQTYSGSAHMALIEVDIETGDVKILKYIVVADGGNIVNPLIVEGQAHGGVIHGLGNARYEQLLYGNDGQLLTSTFMEYTIPSAVEAPEVTVRHSETPSQLTPLGTRGMGEGETVPVPAVIANAIEDALLHLGVRVKEIPITNERLWKLLRDRS